jgi:hypothetical protein
VAGFEVSLTGRFWVSANTFRGVCSDVAQALEKSDIIFNVKKGELMQDRVGQYDSETHVITFNQDMEFSFRSGVVTFAHEGRHAYQDILLGKSPEGSWGKKKWDDVTYREWDAYKYAGDLDDRLGWHEYRAPMDTSCYMQKLNLEVSYAQYYKAFNRLFSWNGSSILRDYRNEFIRQGLVLTQNDYNSR